MKKQTELKSLNLGMIKDEWEDVAAALELLGSKGKKVTLSTYIQTCILELKKQHCKKQYIKPAEIILFKRPKVTQHIHSSIEQIGLALKMPACDVVYQLVIRPLLMKESPRKAAD